MVVPPAASFGAITVGSRHRRAADAAADAAAGVGVGVSVIVLSTGPDDNTTSLGSQVLSIKYSASQTNFVSLPFFKIDQAFLI